MFIVFYTVKIVYVCVFMTCSTFYSLRDTCEHVYICACVYVHIYACGRACVCMYVRKFAGGKEAEGV